LRLDRRNHPSQSAITRDRGGTRIGKNFHKPTIERAPIQRKLLARNGGNSMERSRTGRLPAGEPFDRGVFGFGNGSRAGQNFLG
jgi:hypothetical protein